MEKVFLKDALFAGMTVNAFKLGTVLTLGWFWPRTSGCSVLYRTSCIEQIDSAHVLTVADLDADTISPPDYLSHDNNENYFYVVRRVNGCGFQEYTTAASVKVSINSDGGLAESKPNKIFAFDITQVLSNKIQLLWYYCPVGQKTSPARFLIYCDGGTGQIDYENPIASIDYQGRRFYSYLSNALDACRYLFAIRTEDAISIEDASLAHLEIQLNTTNPDAIDILSAKAI